MPRPPADSQVPDANPIMQAAKPLLILLANLRIAPNRPSIAPLMDSVALDIQRFERQLQAAGVPEQQVTTAKYAMCATADDIVQNLPGSDRQIWTQYSMLSRFFQTRTSGIGFFEELAKVKTNPALNGDLLELMHACMSLGFEGQYRAAAGGDVGLQQVRRDVYQTVRHVRARADDEISPHWRGQDLKPEHARLAVPAWAVGAGAAAALLGIFVLLRLLLSGSADALADRLATLHPDTPVELSRTAFTPFEMPEPDSTQLQRIRAALASDIKAKKLSVEPAGKDILVRLLNDSLFDSGSATVRKGFKDVIKRVSAVLDKESDRILVVGFTDNAPIKASVRFKDNQDLSVQRAEAVAALMKPDLSSPAKVSTDGRGEDEPVASNKTREGRARNRRVDIRIPRID
jgi:type VI secretion system protein ImpK